MDKFLTNIFRCLGYLSRFLSIKSRISLGRFIGNLMRIISKSRLIITIDNLTKAFPEKSNSEIYKIAIESYHNLGIVLVEVVTLRYLNEVDMHNYVHYDNIELINEVYSRGKGLILLSGHFGNWEFLAYTAGLFTKLPILIIVKPQKNAEADKLLNEYRTAGGNEIISMFNAARIIVKSLRNGKAIALLADQSANGEKDIFVDFFGRPAATYEAPASLALKYDVPIICGFSIRQPEGHYNVKLMEIEFSDLENNQNGIKILTERHVKLLETAIRENPGLWAWQHKRWKFTPQKN